VSRLGPRSCVSVTISNRTSDIYPRHITLDIDPNTAVSRKTQGHNQLYGNISPLPCPQQPAASSSAPFSLHQAPLMCAAAVPPPHQPSSACTRHPLCALLPCHHCCCCCCCCCLANAVQLAGCLAAVTRATRSGCLAVVPTSAVHSLAEAYPTTGGGSSGRAWQTCEYQGLTSACRPGMSVISG
jgi:hypothetical protein